MFPDLTLNLEFQKDDESGWFTVHVVELPGCVSQGATVDEARANIADAQAAYLEVVREAALDGQQEQGLDVAETALLSEGALAVDCNRPQEDEAWAYLQRGPIPELLVRLDDNFLWIQPIQPC